MAGREKNKGVMQAEGKDLGVGDNATLYPPPLLPLSFPPTPHTLIGTGVSARVSASYRMSTTSPLASALSSANTMASCTSSRSTCGGGGVSTQFQNIHHTLWGIVQCDDHGVS